VTEKKKDKPPVRPRHRRWPWVLLGVFVFFLVAGVGALWVGYVYFSYDLPKLDQLSDYRPKIITRFYSDDGTVIGEFFRERREVVPLQRMPQHLINAFVSAEDSKFFEHPGVDLWAILRAALRNIEAGRIVQGGSTITQQVCKSFLLTPEKSYRRKIREAILAYRIDKRFTKNEILYLYLNQIYLGEGTYGVEAAAQSYFDKSVEDLSLAESAMLAGLPQAPSRYSPRHNPGKARERQLYVLHRLVAEGYINQDQADQAAAERVTIKTHWPNAFDQAPYFVEHVRRLIEKKYGTKTLLEDGLKVYTTVNLGLQEAAQAAVLKGLADLDKREGYRGPVEHLKPGEIDRFVKELKYRTTETDLAPERLLGAVVLRVGPEMAFVHLGRAEGILELKDMRWARRPNPDVPYYAARVNDVGQALLPGDVILVRILEKSDQGRWRVALEQEPFAQGALVCMESASGQVKALVGGQDFNRSQFNRATQAKRQPGSAFKPIIYAAALDKGFTPASIILDSPVVYKIPGSKAWRPSNYTDKFYGPTTVRTAVEQSRNVVTVKIVDQIGVDYVIDYAKKLGIESTLTPNLSMALGANEVTVLEMVRAYSTFCNTGQKTEPVFITRIEDRNGQLLEEGALQQERVLEPTTAYIVTNLMEGVVQHGTGQRIKALKRPVAGKTGTTNDLKDAWFMGFTPDLITAVWVGHDDHSSMGKGETGARAAAPIWLDFMQTATEGRPVRGFSPPEGVIFARVERKTGLLAGPDSPEAILECFKPGTVPTRRAQEGPSPRPADFLKQELGG